MHVDRYGLPASTSSQAALDAYVAGADCVLSAVAGYGKHLGRAIEADPSFALAHIALARGLFLDGDVKPAREEAARAREVGMAATPREQSHVNAIALALEGKPVDALAATREHLASWPRDAMVLAPATGVFGLIGFSGHQEREAELYDLLTGLASHYGDDWWFRLRARVRRVRERPARRGMAPDRTEHGSESAQRPRRPHQGARAPRDGGDGAGPRLPRGLDARVRQAQPPALSLVVARGAHRARARQASSARGRRTAPACIPAARGDRRSTSCPTARRFSGAPSSRASRGSAELWREAHDYALKSFPKAGVPFADVHTVVACVANGDFADARATGRRDARPDRRRQAIRRVPSWRRSPRDSARTRGTTGTRRFGTSSRRCRKRCASAAAARSAISSSTRCLPPISRPVDRRMRIDLSRSVPIGARLSRSPAFLPVERAATSGRRRGPPPVRLGGAALVPQLDQVREQ